MSETFGLWSSGGNPVPLTGVRVEAEVLGRGARVRVSQNFVNREEKPLEAVYKFPLSEGSAVCGFKARIDGSMIEGQVEDRDKAFDLYDDALTKGEGGYLLDEERPNIFTLSVGNLKPGSSALIEIEYVVLLDLEGPRIRFVLPTAISPRYIPKNMQEDDGIPVDGKLHPLYADEVPYGLNLTVNIHGSAVIDSVESPTHPVKVDQMKGDPMVVTLTSDSVSMDRDFILYMDYRQAFSNRAYLHAGEKETFLQLDLCLRQDVKDGQEESKDRREVIFVVDCSGSMQGDSIREAKMALDVCLKAMQEGTAFNIYRFGSRFERLFRSAKTYTGKSLDQGVAYLKKMEADLGGTEILSPLKDICSAGTSKEPRLRDVVLLTDGEVGNEDQILDLIRANNDTTRLFTVGIGAGCNEYFIRGVARAGRGVAEFIYPGERIEPKMLRLFGNVGSKRITDLSVDWAGMNAEQAPALPALFLDSPVTILAKIEGEADLTRTIRVKAKIGGKEKLWEVDPVAAGNQGLPVRLLWARERIRDLEESDAGVDARGSRQKERKRDRAKEAIIDLSKKYGLISRFTSFVAIEKRQEKDKVTGEIVLRKVPVLVTTGWHGRGSVFGARALASMPRTMLSIRPAAFDASAAEPSFRLQRIAAESPSYGLEPDRDTSKVGAKDDLDVVLLILSRQKASGGIEMDTEVSKALGLDIQEIKKATALMKGSRRVDRFLLLSTAILLTVLELRFAPERNTWESAVKKSKDWLDTILKRGEPKILETPLSEWAKTYAERVR